MGRYSSGCQTKCMVPHRCLLTKNTCIIKKGKMQRRSRSYRYGTCRSECVEELGLSLASLPVHLLCTLSCMHECAGRYIHVHIVSRRRCCSQCERTHPLVGLLVGFAMASSPCPRRFAAGQSKRTKRNRTHMTYQR